MSFDPAIFFPAFLYGWWSTDANDGRSLQAIGPNRPSGKCARIVQRQSLTLLASAVLEAGGDALIRVALQTDSTWTRNLMYVFAAIILFTYGWTVNAPPWDFRKAAWTLCYFLFVIAQIITGLFFNQISLRL